MSQGDHRRAWPSSAIQSALHQGRDPQVTADATSRCDRTRDATDLPILPVENTAETVPAPSDARPCRSSLPRRPPPLGRGCRRSTSPASEVSLPNADRGAGLLPGGLTPAAPVPHTGRDAPRPPKTSALRAEVAAGSPLATRRLSRRRPAGPGERAANFRRHLHARDPLPLHQKR